MEMTAKQSDMLEATHDTVIRLQDSVDRLVKVIDGNGQPGYTQRLTVVEQAQEHCPAREAFKSGNKAAKTANIIAFAAVVISTLAVIRSLM